tara:strand:+ start:5714 stop:9037 length:3324 start_codon:yes stop_codon:yes gene_type:complete
MTAQAKITAALSHLTPVMDAIAQSNPHDAEVRSMAIDPRRSVALRAPAGSGKTTELIYRLMACLTVVEQPEQILTITFTNKAAGEIVERVTGALAMAQTGVEPAEVHEKPLYMLAKMVLERDALLGWNLVLNPSRLRKMTFDAYCAQLAARMPIMSGLGGGRTTESPGLIYRAAILDTLGSVNDETIPSDLRDALEAVLKFAKNQFEILVPMFSNLLMKRDQWVNEILHVNSEDLAAELESLVIEEASSAIQVLNQNGFGECWDIFKSVAGVYQEFSWAGYGNADTTDEGREFARCAASVLLKADHTIRSKVNALNGFPAKQAPTKRMNTFLSELGDTDDINAALQTLESLPDTRYPDRSAKMVEHFAVILRYLMANLMVAFDSTASVDFPEVAQRAIQAFGDGSVVGDALLEEDRVCHLLVDENQDTSPAQYELLSKLVAHWEPGDDGRSVFLCGDWSQSIYLFRGATVEKFTNTLKAGYFGPKKLDVLDLTVNFRSSPAIVEWNNKIYTQLFSNSEAQFVPSVPFKTQPGRVTVESVSEGSEGESGRVVELVTEAFKEDPNQSVAILVRGRSHLKYILPALKAAGISATGTDIDPIADSAPVSEVVSLIRAMWHEGDRTSWLSLLRSSFVGLSWEDCLTVARGHNVISEALKMASVVSSLTPDGHARVTRLVEALCALKKSSRNDELAWKTRALWVSLGGMATVDSTELSDIKTVFKLLGSHTSNGDLADPQSFFNALSKLFASPKAGSVQIMTIHKSKGLEFDTVILPSLERSGGRDDTPLFHWRTINDRFFLVPNLGDDDAQSAESRLFSFINRKVKNDHREELKRVAYVATTRAKKNLHLLTSKEIDDYKSGNANSLLGCMIKAIGEYIEDVPSSVTKLEVAGGVPSKARLAGDHEVKIPTDSFIPAATNEALPTEDELHDELREGEGSDFRSKVEGVVYHRFVEMIAKNGLEGWDADAITAKAQAVAALMRREGYPIREIPAGRDRVISLLITTVQSEMGRWILSPHQDGGQEVQVSGYRNGRWIHRYLDRPFVDKGTYWITDWKTATCPKDVNVEDFVRAIASRYRAKMEEYRSVVIEAGISLPIKLGLYLPAVDRFVVI